MSSTTSFIANSKINALQWSQCTISDFGRQSPERRETEAPGLCTTLGSPLVSPGIAGYKMRGDPFYRTARQRTARNQSFSWT